MSFVESQKEVWGVHFFDELMQAVENGRDIEVVLSKKNELHVAAQKMDADYLNVVGNIKQISDKLATDENKLKQFDKVLVLMSGYIKDVCGLKSAFPDIEPYNRNLQQLLNEYLDSGEFENRYLDKLRIQPEKIMDRLKYGKQVKRAVQLLNAFVEKFTKDNVYKLIQSDVKNDITKRNFINQLKQLSLSKENNETERSILVGRVESDRYDLEQKEKVKKYMEDQLQQKMDKEDNFVRQFVSDAKKDIMTPPKLNVQDWVERLDTMKDDEMVMFNIRTAARYSKHDERRAVLNIFKYNCLDVGAVEETDKWCYSQGIDTVTNDVELFSPIMRVDDAKKIIPKLLYDLSRAHLSSNLVVAMHPDELLRVVPRRYDNDDAMKTIIDAMKSKQLVWYKDALDCEKFYPEDEYLFSGSMVSDDYMMLSRRPGRNGIVYATNHLDFAHNYVGISGYTGHSKEFYEPDYNINQSVFHNSATTDNYREASRCQYEGQKVHVGFITVYKQNPLKDRYFNDFGPERAMLSRWDGFGELGKLKKDKGQLVETFVTPEKNPVADKILLLAWNNHEFVIPMSQNMPENVRAAIQKIIGSYTATMEYTLDEYAVSDYDEKLTCAKRLVRFTKQKQENDAGIVHSCDALKRAEQRKARLNNQQASMAFVNSTIANQNL